MYLNALETLADVLRLETSVKWLKVIVFVKAKFLLITKNPK
jgi:hypothetical protein